MKKAVKIIGKFVLAVAIFFVTTFAIYMLNGENKFIFYVVRPILNRHYDSQKRDVRL